MDRQVKDYARFPSISSKSDVFEPISSNNAKQRATLIEWLNGVLPDLCLPINASDEELRAFLVDGFVLCQILNKLKPGSLTECDGSTRSPQSCQENVQRFLSTMDEMGLPRFQVADLEKGSMKIVLDCLLTLQTYFLLNTGRYNGNDPSSSWKLVGERLRSVDGTPKDESFRSLSSPPFGEDRRKLLLDSKSQRGLRSPKMTAAVISHVGHKFHEVFQLRQGSYKDLPAAKISEMMKSNSLDNAPTQSLLSVVNGILDESVELKNGEIPHRVACLLRKVVQEIERRICTQAEHLRTQNNLFKAREEKYQSRIRVLEALATGTSEETQIVMNQLQQIKSEKNKIEEKKKVEEHDTIKLTKEKDDLNQEITNLRQELREKDDLNQEILNLKQELEVARRTSVPKSSKMKAMKDKDEHNPEIANLRQELKLRDELNQEITNLRQELIVKDEHNQERANLRQELKEKDELNPEMANLRQQLKAKDDFNQEIANLRQQLKAKDELNQEIANLMRELKAKDEHNQERANLRQELKEKDELNQEIANLRQQLKAKDELNQEKEQKLKEKDELNQKIAILRQQLKGKEELNQEIANLRQQLKEKDELNQEIANVRRELKAKDELNQEIANLMRELKAKDEHNQEGEHLRQELKEKDKLNQEIANLRQELKEKDELNQEISNLRQELKVKDELSQEIANLRQQLKAKDELNQEIANLRQQLKAKDELNQEISNLRQELKEKDKLNQEISNLRQELKEKEKLNQEIANLRQELKEKEKLNQEIANLRQELEITGRSCEQEYSKMKAEALSTQQELENRLKEAQSLLTESRNRVKELEALSKSKTEWWNKKQHIYHIFTEFQLGALRELRFASQSIQQEIVRTQNSYSEEFNILGLKIKILGDAAKNYYPLLAENRKMHNELQELKGNIRVYCRIRPFLPGQKGRQSIVEYIGEDGELIVVNPSKQGKEGRRSFRFDKVYGPTATQAEVFTDTQPLIQSVLDGYNVCIFAYGQTGSGKTYTMTGPDGATEEEWGVNYRALNDLFRISQSRGSIYKYEVSVQMVEIYNEQVRDLLSNDGQKKLGIVSASQSNGLAVPDACIQEVNSTSDVLKLMDIGLQNRAKSSTALNERSSRSHSIVSIHTRGLDLKSGSSLRGSLHLVDLAGSERVDRSEVTGDRLKEAQHINKSLSALGDVIFALAQKSAHVPYRNSKLTQVLQSSLGGRAKTLMFVQLNPDATSYSETISTLKFAERVSGVELGAAKSSKDGRDVRELMEQVASLKDTIAQKDEEIEALQMLKDPKNGATSEKRSTNSLRLRALHKPLTFLMKQDRPTIDKPKLTSRVPRPTKKSARESPKGSTGLRKAHNGTNLSSKSPRRWQ